MSSQTMKEYLNYAMSKTIQHSMLGARRRGMRFSQYHLLRRIAQRGSVTVGEMSSELEVTNPAMSQKLDRMVGGGLLKRMEDRADRRIRHHCISDVGQALLQEIDRERFVWVDELYAGLSEEEREILNRAWDILCKQRSDIVE